MIAPALALSALLASQASAVDPRTSAAWWIDTYGAIAPESSPSVAAAERTLERLWIAAGQRLGLPPRLVVLAKNRPGLLALSLPDNSVIMSRAGLEFCLGQRTRGEISEAGQARLALVLAHELDHIVSEDDWHISAFARDDNPPADVRKIWGSRDVHQAAELRADANAVLLLVAAGLDPRGALEPTSFLEEWTRQRIGRRSGQSATHPDEQRRAELMRRQMERLVAELPLFETGVTELHAGHGQAALRAFDGFHRRTRYAGKELLNNIGLAHYVIGVEALSRCDPEAPLRFRLGTRVDRSFLSRVKLRGPGTGSCLRRPEVADPLSAAAQSLEDAVAADPTWLTARLNLITVLTLAHHPREAYAQAGKLSEEPLARRFRSLSEGDPARLAAENALAVCDYLVRRDMHAPVAEPIAALRNLSRRHPREPALLYNLARMLQETGAADDARSRWASYVGLDRSEPYASAGHDALQSLGGP